VIPCCFSSLVTSTFYYQRLQHLSCNKKVRPAKTDIVLYDSRKQVYFETNFGQNPIVVSTRTYSLNTTSIAICDDSLQNSSVISNRRARKSSLGVTRETPRFCRFPLALCPSLMHTFILLILFCISLDTHGNGPNSGDATNEVLSSQLFIDIKQKSDNIMC